MATACGSLHPVPTSADVLAILDRIVRRVARRLAAEARDDDEIDVAPDVLAQVQAEAATTWRSPSDGKPAVRGAERLRAWHAGFSLHAGVVIAEHDRAALERLCRLCGDPHNRQYADRRIMRTYADPALASCGGALRMR